MQDAKTKMKEITFEEAKKVIEEWGVDTDNYSAVNLKHFMNGGEPDDNSIETHNYHQKCLKIVVNAGLKANPLDALLGKAHPKADVLLARVEKSYDFICRKIKWYEKRIKKDCDYPSGIRLGLVFAEKQFRDLFSK